MTRKAKEVADARRREAESQSDEKGAEKRELERKTDEYLKLLQEERRE